MTQETQYPAPPCPALLMILEVEACNYEPVSIFHATASPGLGVSGQGSLKSPSLPGPGGILWPTCGKTPFYQSLASSSFTLRETAALSQDAVTSSFMPGLPFPEQHSLWSTQPGPGVLYPHAYPGQQLLPHTYPM